MEHEYFCTHFVFMTLANVPLLQMWPELCAVSIQQSFCYCVLVSAIYCCRNLGPMGQLITSEPKYNVSCMILRIYNEIICCEDPSVIFSCSGKLVNLQFYTQ